MGQSTVIAAAFSAAIFLFGIFITTSTSLNSIQTIASMADEKAALIDQINGQRCRLDSWRPSDTYSVVLNVTNIGDESIRLPDFNSMEIFTLCNTNVTAHVSRLQYGHGITSDYWEISKVFFNGREGEIVDPIVVASNSGAWDPGETIQVTVHISENSSSVEYLTFVMGSGYETSLGKVDNTIKGTATILSGSLSVAIGHSLGSLPSGVQVTPQSQINGGFWVSNITSTAFTINISSSEDHNVRFYWAVSR